jgi:tellurite resistance protein
MKVEIPDNLKTEVPSSIWGKILTATPVIMTVIATALAGLSTSEMSRAQYSRSLAAQQQSKAGDQWAFFQAKRLRGAMQRSTLDVLTATTPVQPLDTSAINTGVAKLDDATRQLLILALTNPRQPSIPPTGPLNHVIQQALDALNNPDPAMLATAVAQLDDATLAQAVVQARNLASAYDAAMDPVTRGIDSIEQFLHAGDANENLKRNFVAARLAYNAARYDSEAQLNRSIANLYELQVRRSNRQADRHHARSLRFFFGMLGAQAAVIVATFAIAARKRNLLWTLAALAGTAAVAFAIHVYLFV